MSAKDGKEDISDVQRQSGHFRRKRVFVPMCRSSLALAAGALHNSHLAKVSLILLGSRCPTSARISPPMEAPKIRTGPTKSGRGLPLSMAVPSRLSGWISLMQADCMVKIPLKFPFYFHFFSARKCLCFRALQLFPFFLPYPTMKNLLLGNLELRKTPTRILTGE